MSPPEEVREKFRKVKPLEKISTKQRSWTLDVLNIVRRVTSSEGRAPRVPNLQEKSKYKSGTQEISGTRRAHPSEHPDVFTNEDIYTFAPELEKLHPDNRHIRDI